MADSVAPKERINIVYEAKTGGRPENKELPLKLAILGDYTLQPDSHPLEERQPVSINKSNFNDVMSAHKLSLDLTVPNRLSGLKAGGKEEPPKAELPVHLEIKSLKDFGPDSIVQGVPALNKLLQIREALKFLRGPLGNNREFRRRLEAIVTDEKSRDELLRELGM